MSTQISGDIGVSQCQPNSVSQDDLQPPIQKKIAAVSCVFNGLLTGTNPPVVGDGVTTVTRSTVGNYAVNFAVPFADTNYVAIAITDNQTLGIICTIGMGSTISELRIRTYDKAGVLTDAGQVNVVIFKL